MELAFLPLLLFCYSGLQAQMSDPEENRLEGEALSFQCHYKAQPHSHNSKIFCKLTEGHCQPLVQTTPEPAGRYIHKASAGRFRIEDNTTEGVVTLTIEELTEQDSGQYMCVQSADPGTLLLMKKITLNVFKVVQNHSATELQSLSIMCPYNVQNYSNVQKAWCQRKEEDECDVLVSTYYYLSAYQNKVHFWKSTISDNTQKGMVTITMQKLQAEDSGVYWCALRVHSHFSRIMQINLSVSKKMQEHVRKEMQTFSAVCPYNSQDYRAVQKVWCKKTTGKDCVVLVSTEKTNLQDINKAQKGRYSLKDDTQRGLLNIIVERVTVQDAGKYWCAISYNLHLFRIMEIQLLVLPSEAPNTLPPAYANISFNSSETTPRSKAEGLQWNRLQIILWLVIGVVSNKTLAVVILVFLTRRRNSRKEVSGRQEAAKSRCKRTNPSRKGGRYQNRSKL